MPNDDRTTQVSHSSPSRYALLKDDDEKMPDAQSISPRVRRHSANAPTRHTLAQRPLRQVSGRQIASRCGVTGSDGANKRMSSRTPRSLDNSLATGADPTLATWANPTLAIGADNTFPATLQRCTRNPGHRVHLSVFSRGSLHTHRSMPELACIRHGAGHLSQSGSRHNASHCSTFNASKHSDCAGDRGRGTPEKERKSLERGSPYEGAGRLPCEHPCPTCSQKGRCLSSNNIAPSPCLCDCHERDMSPTSESESHRRNASWDAQSAQQCPACSRENRLHSSSENCNCANCENEENPEEENEEASQSEHHSFRDRTTSDARRANKTPHTDRNRPLCMDPSTDFLGENGPPPQHTCSCIEESEHPEEREDHKPFAIAHATPTEHPVGKGEPAGVEPLSSLRLRPIRQRTKHAYVSHLNIFIFLFPYFLS